jgi:bacteriocin biosynthesis cyclodehydratase domain-containing protein
LRGALELFLTSDGDVYLLRGGAGPEFVLRGLDDRDRELLQCLADDGVVAAAGTPEAERIAPLVRAGAVVPATAHSALAGDDAARFARQLPYLEDYGDPVCGQRTLRSSSVGILGCGGLGTWALGAIACLGVGRMVLVDGDLVELSNLNRQVLYGVSDIGHAKVGRAAAWINAFDPTIEVVARHKRVRGVADLDVIAGCDAVLMTADWPPYELTRWVNDACLRHGVPFITAGQQPPLLKIGPTYVPGKGACFACHESRLRAEFPLYEELADQRRRHPSAAMTLGPASALIGAVLASEIMHLLLGGHDVATHQRVLLVDMRTLVTRWQSIEPIPGCASCAQAREASGR